MEAIRTFIEEFQNLLLAVSGSIAVIGVLGLGIMYLGSTIPLISEWKQNNPKAFRDVTWGLIFLIFASSGGVVALLGN